MARLIQAIWTCDNCGREARGNFESLLPPEEGWWQLTPAINGALNSMVCSRECAATFIANHPWGRSNDS